MIWHLVALARTGVEKQEGAARGISLKTDESIMNFVIAGEYVAEHLSPNKNELGAFHSSLHRALAILRVLRQTQLTFSLVHLSVVRHVGHRW